MRDNTVSLLKEIYTTDAVMEDKSFIQPILENRGLVIMTRLDVQKAFDSASWPAILQGLRDFNCPRNLFMLSKEFFSNRKTVINTKKLHHRKTYNKRMSARILLRTRILEHSI
jgi:hypothetical protein